jgi:hypothetical protein
MQNVEASPQFKLRDVELLQQQRSGHPSKTQMYPILKPQSETLKVKSIFSAPAPSLSTPDLLYHHHHVSHHSTLPHKHIHGPITHASAAATLNRYSNHQAGSKRVLS